MKRTVVLGASPDPKRTSNQAAQQLIEHGHEVVLVNPKHKEIDGHAVVQQLIDVTGEVDTLTIYVNKKVSDQMEEVLITFPTKRVVFNPGAENKNLQKKLNAAGKEVIEGCTLVMLGTGQY